MHAALALARRLPVSSVSQPYVCTVGRRLGHDPIRLNGFGAAVALALATMRPSGS